MPRLSRSLLAAGVGLTLLTSLPAGAFAATAKPAATRSVHDAFDGVWVSRNKSIPEGVAAGYPLPLGSTPWASLSAGRPESVKIESYAVQRAAIEKYIAGGGDVFVAMAAARRSPPYTPEGQKALEAMQAAQKAAKRGPYDQCLPRNVVGVFGGAGGAGGGAAEIFTAAGHLGVITENGGYFMIRTGKVDASKFTPTYSGTSVGHWEGDRLVIVTSNFIGDSVNAWPASPMAKVTETVWLSPDRKMLTIKSVYEDPAYAREPMARMLYLDRGDPNFEFLPVNCVESVQGAAAYAETFGATPPK